MKNLKHAYEDSIELKNELEELQLAHEVMEHRIRREHRAGNVFNGIIAIVVMVFVLGGTYLIEKVQDKICKK